MGSAPLSRRQRGVGIDARILVSSVISHLSSSGTLRSARTSARLPRSSSSLRSRSVFFATRVALKAGADEAKHVHAARRVSPLVVVPSGDLHQRAVNDDRGLRIEDARCGIADVVAGDKLFLSILEIPAEIA